MNKIEKAQWCYSCGQQFEDAFYLLIAEFDAINKIWKEQVERPSYYCAGFAIEQFLKSYLSLESIIFPENHKGHNLISLISLQKNKIIKFFDFTKEDIAQIEILNKRYYYDDAYGKDDLRYASKTGLRISPHPDNLNRIIKKMDSKLNLEIHKRYELLNSKKKTK